MYVLGVDNAPLSCLSTDVLVIIGLSLIDDVLEQRLHEIRLLAAETVVVLDLLGAEVSHAHSPVVAVDVTRDDQAIQTIDVGLLRLGPAANAVVIVGISRGTQSREEVGREDVDLEALVRGERAVR